MLNIDSLIPNTKIHFIGIGGISMSGLAQIMHHRGYIVSGSDIKASATTKHLESLGITVFYGHHQNHIKEDVDYAVYTAAIADTNPELIAAKKYAKHVFTRSEFLGLIMKNYDYPICISGTHGKTTTTSMLSHALLGADKDPTITVGGILKEIEGNIRLGGTHYFITEACEYCDSFLDFFPKVGIILNIEEDHMDYFQDIHQIRHSFQIFASKIPIDGFLSINGAIENLDDLLKPVHCQVETFGLDKSYDWYADNIVFNEKACAQFDIYYKGEFFGRISLSVPGTHNICNCLAVCSVLHYLSIDKEAFCKSLISFYGANQRFEIKGQVHEVTIVDDYAHHPTEISATLNVAHIYPHNHLYVIFQPHTYTRTKAFLTDFAHALLPADCIIVTDIYAAREQNPGDIHAKDIVSEILKLGKDALYISEFDQIANYLLENALPNDLIITMGAGNVNQVGDIILGK